MLKVLGGDGVGRVLPGGGAGAGAGAGAGWRQTDAGGDHDVNGDGDGDDGDNDDDDDDDAPLGRESRKAASVLFVARRSRKEAPPKARSA